MVCSVIRGGCAAHIISYRIKVCCFYTKTAMVDQTTSPTLRLLEKAEKVSQGAEAASSWFSRLCCIVAELNDATFRKSIKHNYIPSPSQTRRDMCS